jgi:hypothetical protein
MYLFVHFFKLINVVKQMKGPVEENGEGYREGVGGEIGGKQERVRVQEGSFWSRGHPSILRSSMGKDRRIVVRMGAEVSSG